MCVFSVIVPIYNIPEKYLRRCIESSVNQGTESMEVILVDDGSKPYCGDICREFETKYSYVQYIRQENQGVSVARNQGLLIAKGEYIVFLDADDWIPDNFLGYMVDRIPDNRPDIVMYEYGSEYSNKGLRRTLSNSQISKLHSKDIILSIMGENNAFLPYDVGTIWAKFIKRSVIEEHEVRFPVGVVRGQDTVFMLYLYNKCKTFMFMPVMGYYYRKNNGSISHRLNPEIVSIDGMLFSQYENFLRSSDIDVNTDAIMNNIRARALIGEYLNLYFCHRDNPKSRSLLQQEYRSLIEEELYKTAISNAQVKGFLPRLKIKILRKKHINNLWILKRIENIVKRVYIREYV